MNVLKLQNLFTKMPNFSLTQDIKGRILGLRQDVPSAKTFEVVMEEIFKKCQWHDYGINVNGKQLVIMKFVDDLVLIGKFH